MLGREGGHGLFSCIPDTQYTKYSGVYYYRTRLGW